MPTVTVPLRGVIDEASLRTLVGEFLQACGGKIPRDVAIDFKDLNFIRPVGVTFLGNFIDWLRLQGAQVKLAGTHHYTDPIWFLDDALFFERYKGHKLRPSASPRSTTLPLVSVPHEQSHWWLRSEMMPWLARKLSVSVATLHPFHNCVSEIFNNTHDHSKQKIASIFVQHFPNENRVSISIADFGVGIPRTVRSVHPDLNDIQAIVTAVRRGFTARSTRGNYGIGLDDLLNSVVRVNGGSVSILSLKGHVLFYNKGNQVAVETFPSSGYCPGTSIAISLRTDTIEEVSEESEDLQW